MDTKLLSAFQVQIDSKQPIIIMEQQLNSLPNYSTYIIR